MFLALFNQVRVFFVDFRLRTMTYKVILPAQIPGVTSMRMESIGALISVHQTFLVVKIGNYCNLDF